MPYQFALKLSILLYRGDAQRGGAMLADGGAPLVELLGGQAVEVAGFRRLDQPMVDCGDDEVSVGDRATLIGRQGDEEITASDWADKLDTIAYEMVCGIGPRVPRFYRR